MRIHDKNLIIISIILKYISEKVDLQELIKDIYIDLDFWKLNKSTSKTDEM
jgi:hypothetical protein